MAKTDEQIDRIFKEGLAQYEVSPRSAAWDKLEAQLDAAKQPKKNFWWAIAAAMPLLLGIGYLIWSQAPQADQESSLTGTEEVLEIPPVLASTPEAETGVSEEGEKPNSLAKTATISSTKPVFKSSLPQEITEPINLEKVVAEAVAFPSHQNAEKMDINSTSESKIWVSPEPTRITPRPSTSQASLAAAEELDGYRIRIFSNGLKKEETPNKSLITELGKTVGQVEGFIDKLDDEFVEIQDKKERLFSTLTSRKTPSIEKQ